MAAERIRQHGLDQQADALNTQSQDRYKDFSGQQDQKASELGQYFADQKIENAGANQAATQELNVPQSSSNVVTQEEDKQRGKADAYGQQQGEALGNLRSFGDLLGGIGREQARDAGAIGQINGFKQGSSAVVPYELEGANSAGAGAQMLGDILGLGGTVALGKGLSGGASSLKTFPAAPKAVASADPWIINGVNARVPSNLYSLYGGLS